MRSSTISSAAIPTTTAQAGYRINVRPETLLDWMQDAHFGDAEIEQLRGNAQQRGRAASKRTFWRG
ncbi:MAG: hypothetical protein R2851_15395 [Caldilineaceae bacterium]